MNERFREKLLSTFELIEYSHDISQTDSFYIYGKDMSLGLEDTCVFLRILEERFPDHVKIIHLYDAVNQEHWLNPPQDPSLVRPIAELSLLKPMDGLKESINGNQKSIDLANADISYDEKKSRILINDSYIQLAPDTKEAMFANLLLSKEPGEFIEWSTALEPFTGEIISNDKERRSFYDSVARINAKVKNHTNTETTLFKRINGNICRCF